MNCGFSEFLLKTTDRQIDLLALNRGLSGGIGIDDYTPGRPNLKGGGVWQDSPIAQGRRPVFGVRGNVADALTIKIAAKSHRSVIEFQIALDEILERATAYWLDDTGSIAPVWIVTRAAGERERRYAIVYGYSFAEYDDPYHEPYLSGTGHVLDGLTLGIERSAWQHLPPGEMTPVEIANARQPTPTTDGVFVTNWQGNGQAVSVHVYDHSSVNYGPDINAGPFPANLLPNPISFADHIYIRSSYPFRSLIFNIGTAVPGGLNLLWEYYDGPSDADWVPLTTFITTDGVNAFRDSGVQLFSFRLSKTSPWVATNFQGMGMGYWIRVGIVTGNANPPPTIVEPVYVPDQPYIELDSNEINGDLDALMMTTLLADEDHRGSSSRFDLFSQIICGARDTDRGAFTAYLEPGNLPTGITFDNSQTEQTNAPTITTDGAAPFATVIRWTGDDADNLSEAFRLDFDATAAANFRGTFRLFMRSYIQNVPANPYGLFRYRLLTVYPSPSATNPNLIEVIGETRRQDLVFNAQPSVTDLGRIQLPPIGNLLAGENSQGFSLILDAQIPEVASVGPQFSFVDFVLIPVDQWACQVDAGMNLRRLNTQAIDWTIDSIADPKTHVRSLIRYSPNTDEIIGSATCITNGPAILKPNTKQRLWFLFAPTDDAGSNDERVTNYGETLNARLYKLQRYHFLRGD